RARGGRTARHDEIDAGLQEPVGEPGKAVCLTRCGTIVELQVLAFDIAALAQATFQSFEVRGVLFCRNGLEDADAVDTSLCNCGKRGYGGPRQKSDRGAPPCAAKISRLGAARHAASHGTVAPTASDHAVIASPPDQDFPTPQPTQSLATTPCDGGPCNEISTDAMEGGLSTVDCMRKSLRRSEADLHSRTSSTRAKKNGGITRPSAAA